MLFLFICNLLNIKLYIVLRYFNKTIIDIYVNYYKILFDISHFSYSIENNFQFSHSLSIILILFTFSYYLLYFRRNFPSLYRQFLNEYSITKNQTHLHSTNFFLEISLPYSIFTKLKNFKIFLFPPLSNSE